MRQAATLCLTLLGMSALGLATAPAAAQNFNVTALVSDNAAVHPAQLVDAGLHNAWGVSYAPTGPFWVSSNGSGTSPLYSVNATTQATTQSALLVSIPGDGSVTGQVFNASAAAFGGDNFLFASEDGTVSGWRGALGTSAQTLVAASPANVYKGLAIGVVNGSSYLYAANFRSATVDIVGGTAAAPGLSGSFVDPNLPSGYAPFNVQNLGGSLYVTYARQDATLHDEIAGAGFGYVDRYDLQGNLLARVASAGALNAPWGLAIAPSSFGAWAGDLLVGNFGDGRISVYDSVTHAFLGQVAAGDGTTLSIDGLWALSPGNGASAGSSSLLYFTAGPDGESHGLFGVLTAAAVPEPATTALWALGLALLAAAQRGRSAARFRYRAHQPGLRLSE